ncbi:MAG TPA: TonB-dependent receptor [Paludibacter sp.]|nr:TonB-dependent receptor [Paludibacter sp.]HOS45537.1 TonB-dependent receptor [Paludibacter sp.]HPM08944.1 TonB-dependent receptor [Paludibacter sp.]
MFKNTNLTIFTLLLSFTIQPQLHGKDSEISSSDSLMHKQISEVTVTGLLSDKLNLTYLVIEGEKALNEGNITPGDLLDRLPGISVERDGPWATTVNIRGFRESKLLFLSDGDRMLTATDVAGALSTVNIGNLEKIEVIKGAGSVIYGTGAMGGIVNFVSKRPEYSDRLSSSGGFSSGFHTVNKLWENNLNVNLTNQNWYLALDGSYRTAQNTMTPIGVQENSQFNDASWGVKGGMRNGENQEFLVNYNHFEARDVGLPGGSAFPANAVVRYLEFKRNQLSGEYIFRELTDVIKSLNVKVYTQNIKRKVENIVPAKKVAIYPGSLNVTTGAKATADLYFNDYETMTVGIEGWHRDQETSRLKIAHPVSDTIYIKELPTPKAQVLDVGIFAQHKWVIDPKYWTMSTGVRLDFLRTTNDTAFTEIARYKYVDGKKVSIPFNKNARFLADAKNEFAYAAHIDFSYKPFESHQFILSLANAYRVASLEERFKYIDQSGTPMIGNPDLKPEKGLFSNLSYKLTKNKFSLNTNIFANYVFDLIGVEEGPYQGVDGSVFNALVNTNVDRAMYLGGELDFRWLIISDVTLEGNVAYVYGADAITKKELPLMPPLHGILRINYALPAVFTLYAETEWDYDFSSEDPSDDQNFIILNAGFYTDAFSLGKLIQLQFVGGAQNIFNTAYKEQMTAARGINRLEPGRNFFVRAKLMW